MTVGAIVLLLIAIPMMFVVVASTEPGEPSGRSLENIITDLETELQACKAELQEKTQRLEETERLLGHMRHIQERR